MPDIDNYVEAIAARTVGARLVRADLESPFLLRTADPRILSGIGNAYSDEILHRARLSPVRLTDSLSGTELAVPYDATRAVLTEWRQRVRRDCAADPLCVE